MLKKTDHKENTGDSGSHEPASSTAEIGTNCDLFAEFTDEDEALFKRIQLTEHQLKLKETDREAFWKSVNETIRADLQDALADNEEVPSHSYSHILFILFTFLKITSFFSYSKDTNSENLNEK